MSKKYNFYAGPAILPQEVMQKAKDELLNFNGIGLSVMEISHRSKDFDKVITGAESKIRTLIGVPDNYSILFLQGGASLQFGMIPMNILNGGKADYINTGAWAKKAIKEAKLFGSVNISGTSEDKNFNYIPRDLNLSSDAKYVHITSNETIGGIQWNTLPDTGNIPLISDMSSDIFSKRIDVAKHAMIYAGAQKNIGPSGVTLVIMRNDLIENANKDITTMLQYKTHKDKDSMYNTPPTFGIYIINLVMDWLESKGGISAMEAENNRKAELLYKTIDENEMYSGTANTEDRSKMNVTFRLKTEDHEARFIKEAASAGFIGLKGHRSVGGCRASIYNAMPYDSVKALVDFMNKFK